MKEKELFEKIGRQVVEAAITKFQQELRQKVASFPLSISGDVTLDRLQREALDPIIVEHILNVFDNSPSRAEALKRLGAAEETVRLAFLRYLSLGSDPAGLKGRIEKYYHPKRVEHKYYRRKK